MPRFPKVAVITFLAVSAIPRTLAWAASCDPGLITARTPRRAAAGAPPLRDRGDVRLSSFGPRSIAPRSFARRIAAGIADVLPISFVHIVGEPLLWFLAASAARRKQVLVVARFAGVPLLARALEIWRGKIRVRQVLLAPPAPELVAIVFPHFLRQDFQRRRLALDASPLPRRRVLLLQQHGLVEHDSVHSAAAAPTLQRLCAFLCSGFRGGPWSGARIHHAGPTLRDCRSSCISNQDYSQHECIERLQLRRESAMPRCFDFNESALLDSDLLRSFPAV